MLLEMRSICKDYPQGKDVVHILKNISLEIDDGDYLAIMGPSGSGKTTLMNIIGALDSPAPMCLPGRTYPRPRMTGSPIYETR